MGNNQTRDEANAYSITEDEHADNKSAQKGRGVVKFLIHEADRRCKHGRRERANENEISLRPSKCVYRSTAYLTN
jgi:hypothetical protein